MNYNETDESNTNCLKILKIPENTSDKGLK